MAESELWEAGLTDSEKLFVLEYCRSFNLTKAYKAAHPDAAAGSMRANAGVMRRRLDGAISKLAAELVRGHRAELEAQLIQIYRARATYQASDLYDKEGFLKPADELGDLNYVIDEVAAFEVTIGKGPKRKKIIKFQPKKLADRNANLDKLDRIIALIKPEDRAGEGAGGYVLLPQNMTTEKWIELYGSGKAKNTDKKADHSKE